MTPEQLVPSLGLCQRAQKLGWKKETWFGWSDLAAITKTPLKPVHKLMLYNGSNIPAPTLQEVLEDIFLSGYRVPTLYSAEAALKLWCELEERKREK